MKIIKPPSDNRAYLALCLRHFAQIPFQETLDTLGTLSAIVPREINNEYEGKYKKRN